MKILFVAVFTPNSTNVAQSRGFTKVGCEVMEYDYRAKLRKLGSIYTRDKDLIETAKIYKPDLVIFSKCNEMHYRVFDAINVFSNTCLWYMDASHNFNTEMIDKVKRADNVICGLRGVLPKALKYNPNSYFIDQCYDELMNFKIPATQKIYDKVFIGNVNSSMHTERSKYIKNCDITSFNGIYGLEHNTIVNQSKINIGFAPTDGSGVSVRTYKIMAAGGFHMTTPCDSLYDSFDIGKHLVIFESIDDFKEKSEYYLNNPEERQLIADRGMKHVIDNYAPNKWAEKIIKIN